MNDIQSITQRGILVENVSGINLHDIRMEIKEGIPFEAKDSKNISWDRITVVTPVADQPYLKLLNCDGVRVTNCYQPEAIPLLINEDEKTENIIIANNILPGTTALVKNSGKNITIINNILKK